MRVGRFNLSIPAGNPRYEIEAGSFVHRPMRLIAIHPHMHMLGREMWDFNWQGFYWFRTPVALPVASWIELTAAWDNSAQNPSNPNKPPRDVSWGERTVDELGHAAILYTLDDEQLKYQARGLGPYGRTGSTCRVREEDHAPGSLLCKGNP